MTPLKDSIPNKRTWKDIKGHQKSLDVYNVFGLDETSLNATYALVKRMDFNERSQYHENVFFLCQSGLF